MPFGKVAAATFLKSGPTVCEFENAPGHPPPHSPSPSIKSAKSPLLTKSKNCFVRLVAVRGEPWRNLCHSAVTKKKVLSFLIGPPIEPPNWFLTKESLMPSLLEKKSFAAKACTRLYSNSEPWNLFAPDLSTVSATNPPAFPYCAE